MFALWIIFVGVRAVKTHVCSVADLFCFHPSLKVEYDKLANEKTEMQRHYVMVRLANM